MICDLHAYMQIVKPEVSFLLNSSQFGLHLNLFLHECPHQLAKLDSVLTLSFIAG